MISSILPPKIFDFRVVLASQSPRRRELLQMLVPDLTIAAIKDVEETYPASLPAEQVPEYLSQLKAEAYKGDLADGEVLLTADTVVVLDGEILGKPIDEADAVAILRKLSGRTHTVVTGVTLTSLHKSVNFSVHTEVDFDKLSDEVIKQYVSTFRPLDKAGAYGIQEWIGAVGIRGIRGSFYNVMGLPLHAVYDRMKEFAL